MTTYIYTCVINARLVCYRPLHWHRNDERQHQSPQLLHNDRRLCLRARPGIHHRPLHLQQRGGQLELGVGRDRHGAGHGHHPLRHLL